MNTVVKKIKKTKKLVNPDYANPVGKTTFIRVDWKDWKKELPPQGKTLAVIVKFSDGYLPVMGEYLEWTSEEKKSTDGKVVMPSHTFKWVRFDSYRLPEIYIKSPEAKRLVAWGELKRATEPKDFIVKKRL